MFLVFFVLHHLPPLLDALYIRSWQVEPSYLQYFHSTLFFLSTLSAVSHTGMHRQTVVYVGNLCVVYDCYCQYRLTLRYLVSVFLKEPHIHQRKVVCTRLRLKLRMSYDWQPVESSEYHKITWDMASFS